MRSRQLLVLFIVTAVTLMLAGCGGGGNDTNQGVYTFKAPPVGTMLTYASRAVNGNYSTNYTYTKSTSKINTDGSYTSILTTYQYGGSNSVTQSYDATGNLLAETATPANSITTFTYTPKVEYFPYPLVVGKTWNSNWTQTNTYGTVANFELTNGVAIGTENITVPAGTFNTVKVQYQITATLMNISFQNPDQPPNAIGGTIIILIPTLTSATCWLATDTSIIVKCQYDYNYDSSIYPIGPTGTKIELLESIQ